MVESPSQRTDERALNLINLVAQHAMSLSFSVRSGRPDYKVGCDFGRTHGAGMAIARVVAMTAD